MENFAYYKKVGEGILFALVNSGAAVIDRYNEESLKLICGAVEENSTGIWIEKILSLSTIAVIEITVNGPFGEIHHEFAVDLTKSDDFLVNQTRNEISEIKKAAYYEWKEGAEEE